MQTTMMAFLKAPQADASVRTDPAPAPNGESAFGDVIGHMPKGKTEGLPVHAGLPHRFLSENAARPPNPDGVIVRQEQGEGAPVHPSLTSAQAQPQTLQQDSLPESTPFAASKPSAGANIFAGNSFARGYIITADSAEPDISSKPVQIMTGLTLGGNAVLHEKTTTPGALPANDRISTNPLLAPGQGNPLTPQHHPVIAQPEAPSTGPAAPQASAAVLPSKPNMGEGQIRYSYGHSQPVEGVMRPTGEAHEGGLFGKKPPAAALAVANLAAGGNADNPAQPVLPRVFGGPAPQMAAIPEAPLPEAPPKTTQAMPSSEPALAVKASNIGQTVGRAVVQAVGQAVGQAAGLPGMLPTDGMDAKITQNVPASTLSPSAKTPGTEVPGAQRDPALARDVAAKIAEPPRSQPDRTLDRTLGHEEPGRVKIAHNAEQVGLTDSKPAAPLQAIAMTAGAAPKSWKVSTEAPAKLSEPIATNQSRPAQEMKPAQGAAFPNPTSASKASNEGPAPVTAGVPPMGGMDIQITQAMSVSALSSSGEIPGAEALGGRNEPALARHIGAQIAEAARPQPNAAANQPVELTLNPEELGRVRLGFATEGGALTVSITTERPETLDLMRRHIEALAQELRNLGYRDVNFSFAQQGQDQAAQNSAKSADASPTNTGDEQAELDGATAAPPPLQAPVSGIDIRL